MKAAPTAICLSAARRRAAAASWLWWAAALGLAASDCARLDAADGVDQVGVALAVDVPQAESQGGPFSDPAPAATGSTSTTDTGTVSQTGTSTGNNYGFLLQTVFGGLCLGRLSSESPSDGRLYLVDCKSTPLPLWHTDRGAFSLDGVSCLSVQSPNIAVLAPCTTGFNQQWELGTFPFYFMSPDHRYYLQTVDPSQPGTLLYAYSSAYAGNDNASAYGHSFAVARPQGSSQGVSFYGRGSTNSCLTETSGQFSVAPCSAGAANQQWSITSSSWIQSPAGRCVYCDLNQKVMVLGACGSDASNVTLGRSSGLGCDSAANDPNLHYTAVPRAQPGPMDLVPEDNSAYFWSYGSPAFLTQP